MIASIFDVAKFILTRCGSMTTMKLQKLCYYCQAWSLAWDGEPLFSEEFEAWANGPVCPQLFSQHRGVFVVGPGWTALPEQNFPFSREQIETMEAVLRDYGSKTPHWLSELTHKEAPWREARAGIPDGMPSTVVIEKDMMQQYYGGLIE